VLFTLILSLALPPAGVVPELPGAGVVGVTGVVPPVDGVVPELPGAGVVGVTGVVPPVDGVFPGLPGAGETEGVTGVDTTLDLTGVVARVTSVADLRTATGVCFGGVGTVVALLLPEEPPPELPVLANVTLID
jgi:hypothetical protein